MSHYSSLKQEPGQGMPGVFPFWKKAGETLAAASVRFRNERGMGSDEKITYAGRLDPAAEGLVLFLAGEARYQKNEYLGLDKTYRLTVLFGIQTDTGDLLGIPVSVLPSECVPAVSDFPKIFSGEQTLPYPLYSSRPVKGKPLFMYARSNEPVEIPEKTITIRKIALLSEETLDANALLNRVRFFTETVVGDFRQAAIKESWEEKLKNGGAQFKLATFRITSSSGAYMRSVAEKMGEQMQIPACAYAIIREKIGDFEVSEFN